MFFKIGEYSKISHWTHWKSPISDDFGVSPFCEFPSYSPHRSTSETGLMWRSGPEDTNFRTWRWLVVGFCADFLFFIGKTHHFFWVDMWIIYRSNVEKCGPFLLANFTCVISGPVKHFLQDASCPQTMNHVPCFDSSTCGSGKKRIHLYCVYLQYVFIFYVYIYIYVPNTFVGKEYDLRLLTKIPSCFTLRWGRPPACFWYVWWESHLPKDHSPSLDSLSFDLGCLFSSFVAKQRKIIMIMTWWNSRCRFHKGYASSLGHWIIGKLRATVKVLENTLWESAPWPTGKLPIYRPVSLWNAYV